MIKLKEIFSCADLEIPFVLIGLGKKGIKIGLNKTGFVYLLDLFGGNGKKEWCALGCMKHLKMIELLVVLLLLMTFTPMVSMVLVLKRVGLILGNWCGI